jgi:hypothetical protein
MDDDDLNKIKKDIERLKRVQFKLHYLITEILTEEQRKDLLEKITKYKVFDF